MYMVALLVSKCLHNRYSDVFLHSQEYFDDLKLVVMGHVQYDAMF